MTEKQISRMADLEFLTELAHALKYGIKTANPSALDALYADNDSAFPNRNVIEEQLTFGLGRIIDLVEIHNTRLASRGNAYSLFAAFVAVQFPGSPLRQDLEDANRDKPFAERANILTNLTSLADALEDNDPASPLHDFVSAARQGTNTEKNRRARFQWFHRALTSEHL
jgi:hypothetical protein